MRLFGYYAWHSFVNQLRKLFKTWMLIFLAICVLFGMLIGFGAAALEDSAEPEEPAAQEGQELPEEEISIEESLGIAPGELLELAVGGIILVVLVFTAIGADKSGSQIFLPADVNLLFSAPMKPQSVLLFRLMNQLGASILASIYLLLQIPNLVLNLGLSAWVALALVAAWCLTLAMAKLVQILLYTVCSTHLCLKRWLRYGIFGLVALLAGAYVLYWKAGGQSYLAAAVGFFNGPISRWVPLWGWLKGFCMYAVEGNLTGTLLCLGATLAGGALLAWIIWHVKADFYEDALAKTEETAALLEQAQSEKGVAVVRRKKDRSEKLRRDGLHDGFGANVFFHKAMYNRFRFAHLGIFTKTAETYLVAAVGVAALCRFVIGTDGLLPVMLTLGVLVFYRTLGNPMAEDTQMDCFLLIPESTWKKLFWSLLGGTANCCLDLLPGILVAALVMGMNPLTALLWLPLIVSVDFFATTVGTFISLSTPASAGKLVKQIVQIVFLYFGLLPDAVILTVGIVTGQSVAAAVICTAVNALLGLAFFALCPLFLEPGNGKKYAPRNPFIGDMRVIRRNFSRLGMGIFSILIVSTVAQVLAVLLMELLWPQWPEHPWGSWLLTFVPMYAIAVPMGLWILRRTPAKAPRRQSLTFGELAVIAIISIFMMYAGNLVGNFVTSLLQNIPGVAAENPVSDLTVGTDIVPRTLFVVILAPFIEEYIFRKQLIDRMGLYGQKLAVFTSALLFGLFHGNFSQLFYAFTLGLVFGYVYLKTGKLRYSIGLHMFINFLGGVVGPLILEKAAILETADPADTAAMNAALPWALGLTAYSLCLIGLAIAGLVLLCVFSRRITFREAELELPRGSRFKTVCWNPGMLLLIAGCAAMILLSVF